MRIVLLITSIILLFSCKKEKTIVAPDLIAKYLGVYDVISIDTTFYYTRVNDYYIVDWIEVRTGNYEINMERYKEMKTTAIHRESSNFYSRDVIFSLPNDTIRDLNNYYYQGKLEFCPTNDSFYEYRHRRSDGFSCYTSHSYGKKKQ